MALPGTAGRIWAEVSLRVRQFVPGVKTAWMYLYAVKKCISGKKHGMERHGVNGKIWEAPYLVIPLPYPGAKTASTCFMPLKIRVCCTVGGTDRTGAVRRILVA